MSQSRRFRIPDWFDGPQRLALLVGLVVGLLFVFVAPPWSGGADEGSHFARSLDIAHGNLTPQKTDFGVFSAIPRTYRIDQDLVIANFDGPAPLNGTMLRTLLDSRPDWNDTVDYDTQATTAASPLGYLPSALGMSIPNAFGWSGTVVLWFGRLFDLAVYLGLVGLALGLARAFRWSLAFAAIIPMNLAMAAAVTPDGLTIAAVGLVVAVWTRVWMLHSDPESDIHWRTIGLVAGSGLLLALAKPPYFLILGLFVILGLLLRRNRTALVSAGVAIVAMAVGLVSGLVNVSTTYSGVAVSLGDGIVVQPDVQRERLLGDPLGFLGRCVTDWFGNIDATVQTWTRRLGIWTSDPPIVLAWVLIAAFVIGAAVLDSQDLFRLRRTLRWSFGLGVAAMIVVIYASAFVYFDDTVDGRHMGDQIARYSLPLFALAVVGWFPRWTLVVGRRILGDRVTSRTGTAVVISTAVACEAFALSAMLVNWLSSGRP